MTTNDLERFVSEVCGDSHLRVEKDLGDGFVRLRSSEAERRQAAQDIRCSEDIVIEMLRNARDAHARNIFVAVTREGSARSIVMIDDGDGIPDHLQNAVFEPRVTSKLDSMHMDKWGVHGRGMALYSISVNADEALVLASGRGLGSAFAIKTDITHLPEKTDQSTFPTFELSDNGTVHVRGPKNILRIACEFAVESRKSCSVFMGSATEIAAALLMYGCASGVLSSAVSNHDDYRDLVGDLPVCKRLATASDPASLRVLAQSIGLVMSERSCRRVLDGTISSPDPLLDQIKIQGAPTRDGDNEEPSRIRARSRRKSQALQLSNDVKTDLIDNTMRAFEPVAEAYYLRSDIEPSLRVSKDAITITIPIVERD